MLPPCSHLHGSRWAGMGSQHGLLWACLRCSCLLSTAAASSTRSSGKPFLHSSFPSASFPAVAPFHPQYSWPALSFTGSILLNVSILLPLVISGTSTACFVPSWSTVGKKQSQKLCDCCFPVKYKFLGRSRSVSLYFFFFFLSWFLKEKIFVFTLPDFLE